MTANDELPIDFLDAEEMLTARSIENFFVPDAEPLSPQFFIGLSTEEDGSVKPVSFW
jgi:hypothetical protein